MSLEFARLVQGVQVYKAAFADSRFTVRYSNLELVNF